jgi:hypothetical protein
MLAFLYRVATFLCVLFFLDGRARTVEEQREKYWNDPICLLAFYTISFSYVMFIWGLWLVYIPVATDARPSRFRD